MILTPIWKSTVLVWQCMRGHQTLSNDLSALWCYKNSNSRLQQLILHVLINYKLLLYGNTRLTPNTNILIQEHLSTYLIEFKRFPHNHNRRNWILKCITSTLLLLLLIVCPWRSIIPHNLPQTSPYLHDCIIAQPICYTIVSRDVLFYNVEHYLLL